MARPTIPLGCHTCGEWRPEKFSAGYKTRCSACRAAKERERAAAIAGRPIGAPRKPVEPPPPRHKRRPRRASWVDVIAPRKP